jgi:hypothetical protein
VAVLGAAEALARWWLVSEALSAQAAAELLISTLEPGLRLRSAGGSGGETRPARATASSGRDAQGSGRKGAGR